MPHLVGISWFGIVACAACTGETIRLGDGMVSGGSAGQAGGGRSATSATGIGAVGASSTGGSSGGCRRGQVKASEVLWIGDSWVIYPGTQNTHVRDLARAAGAIGPDDEYVVRAQAAAALADVVAQYEAQRASAIQPKVLIMDGGTWDTLNASDTDAAVERVANEFPQFLAEVARDASVEHIIYYLMPELPTIAGVSALRPSLMQACAESAVPCHFLDLQPFWVGHSEYTASNGIQASEAGATLIADEIWRLMQQNCIAQ